MAALPKTLEVIDRDTGTLLSGEDRDDSDPFEEEEDEDQLEEIDAQVRRLFESGVYSRGASIRSYTVVIYEAGMRAPMSEGQRS